MFERSIEEGLKLRKEKTAEIEREEKNINKELFKRYFTNYTLLSLSDMYKKLCKTEGARNENWEYLIKRVLKNMVKNVPVGNASKIGMNEKIKYIVERILCFNQSGQGLKILTPNQMLSRLSISLAQLKARNNYEKLKNEIRQLLYSLYRSKKHYKKYLWKLGWHYLKHGDNIYEQQKQ